MAYDVFISYSSHDKAVADAACANLESRGIRCWIAPRDVLPGTPYGEAIIDAIHRARVMVLVLSSHANASGHIPKEVERAVSRGLTIVPLRIENVLPARSLDYFIGSVHWLDALTPPLEQHLENLADTILRILPQAEGVAAAPGRTIPSRSTPAAPPSISTYDRRASSLPTWLLPVLGGFAVLVVLAAGASVLFRNGEDPDPVPAPVVETPQPVTAPVVPERPATRAVADADVVGCWNWFLGGVLEFLDDGSVQAGPFTGQWRQQGPSTYVIRWPQPVDRITISADGNALSGVNQYGFPMTAARLSGRGGLAGTWRWFNGTVVTVDPNGRLQAGPFKARWEAEDATGRSVRITWPEAVDTLRLSSDRQRLAGSNQYGVQVSGTRSPTCTGR